jgi:TolB-like protein
MDELLKRLKERKLVQWALAYLAGAFALIQVLDVVAQRFGWPELAERLFIVVLAIGFFVAIVLAWYHGEKGVQRISGTELLILALLLAIGGGLLWRLMQTPRDTGSVAVTAKTSAPATVVNDKSIAVLPFENLSDDKANAYFAEGMQDEILTRLAGIADLKVISRTSTKRYESRPDNLKVVGAELGAAHILEGSVQKSGESVRVNVQLIDARTDTHLWAQTFDRELKNVFVVESEVAQQIADVLKARLSPQETSALAKAPTQNAAAYDQFLKAEYQAHKALDSLEESDSLSSDAEYRKAIALDSGFALAHARMAYNQLRRHWNVRPFSAAQLADVKATIDQALALAPDLAETHLALGYYYYWGFRSYDEALAEFNRVLELAPSNAQALSAVAYIHRRRGDWELALESMRKALLISPRDANLIDETGVTYALLRRYAEAEQQLIRALAIDPEDSAAKDYLWIVRLFGRGDVQGARAAYEPPPGWRIGANSINGGEVYSLINPRVYLHVYERHFDAALNEWDSAPVQSEEDRLTRRSARVAIQIIAHQQQSMQSECAQLKTLLDAKLTTHPESSLAMLQQVSWVDVCLGRNADARAAAQRAIDLLPIAKDAYYGPYQLAGLAQIDAYTEAPDEAFKLIEQLLTIPAGSNMTIERLQHDPLWDPLRKDPRFDAMLKKYETRIAEAPHG